MRALIVDDEPGVLREMVLALEQTTAPDGKPYEVNGVGSYEKALDIMASQRFDVVITDIVMGKTEREGLLVGQSVSGKSPVTIMATAQPKYPVCVEAMRLGAWDYLEKQPADGSDFYENLHKSLEAAWESRREFPDAGRMHPDMAWAEEHYGELAEKYPGKYVAVLDQKDVDSDDDYGALMARLESKYQLAYPSIISLPPKQEEGKEYI